MQMDSSRSVAGCPYDVEIFSSFCSYRLKIEKQLRSVPIKNKHLDNIASTKQRKKTFTKRYKR